MQKRSNLSTNIPIGGIPGQVIVKKSYTDYDVGWADVEGASTFDGVKSFNGRTGDISPVKGDYTPDMVGADPAGTAKELTDDLKSEIPKKISDLQNDSNFATIEEVREEIASSGGGSGGTTNHAVLINRDAENQHPISAITGLADSLSEIEMELNNIPEKPTAITNLELEELLK